MFNSNILDSVFILIWLKVIPDNNNFLEGIRNS